MMLRRINPTMWAVWLMTVCGVPAATVVALHTTMDAFFAPLLPRIDAGVISYAWMLLATYLSTRPHWLDRLIGLPSIYMMHGVLGVAALAVAVLHRIDLPAYGPAKWAGEVAFWMLLALVVVALVTLSGWLSGRFVAAAKLRRSVERVVPREGSVRLHRLLPVAVVAVAVHMNLVWYIAQNVVFVSLMNACTAVVLVWCVLSKLRERFGAARGSVLSVASLADGVWQIEVSVPSMADGWLEGDFVFLRFPGIHGMHALHPFSVVNRPNAAGMMMFAIRADGDFTRMVGSELNPGTVTEVVGPYGRYRPFIDGHDRHAVIVGRTGGVPSRRCIRMRPVVAYAGGIGVTPLLPVIRYVNERGYDVTMLYSARTNADLLYHDELLRWAARTGNRIRMRVGRFTEDEFVDAMRPGALYLIGGPESMRRDVTRILIRHGVRSCDICYEPFVW